ncbi:creatinase [Rhodovulum imhoffii]|uniref:Creatinase n=1 Tax=Rhodovulum imhoffii TaxID=365340 RepID=A0A2T5BS22_9RHOB|nr:aminopeptidase P family protein [Rhodovulum imhoffii]MBK5933163.1 creatininase [Rhodovulum imhoffii]PTN02103.1 creatinase [Rhodovulum imhoffii]
MRSDRPAFYRFHNGLKAALPFAPGEYAHRLMALRSAMDHCGAEAVLLSSVQNVAYYCGFLYCAFGRPYGLVVTARDAVLVAAGIDGGQPWRRSFGDVLTYTDWARGNFWRAVAHLAGTGRTLGVEADHLTCAAAAEMRAVLSPACEIDIAPATMQHRMRKSPAEMELIRAGAAVADLGGHAMREAVRAGVRELDVAMAGREAMEAEIARRFPDAEYRDTWVWFQSGSNTDGAHNPVTSRRLRAGDLLSLNAFPMISGYYTALERTMFLGMPDAETRRIWQANVEGHEYGLSLLKPGARCRDIVDALNAFYAERGLLEFRSFGYGHSFGLLSHYYGREAALELREDVETVLEPGMVISMEPMLTVPLGRPGAGGYREHDIVLLTESGAENVTGYPCGPGFNVIPA